MSSTDEVVAHAVDRLQGDIRSNILRKGFIGLSKYFEKANDSNVLTAAKLVEYWTLRCPALEERIDHFVKKKETTKYRNKWSLRNMSDVDRNKITIMFRCLDNYEKDSSDFHGEAAVDMYLICLIFFCDRKDYKLPKTAKADTYGLWPAFCELFPSTSAAFGEQEDVKKRKRDEETQATEPKKRKRANPSTYGEKIASLIERVSAIEQALASMQSSHS